MDYSATAIRTATALAADVGVDARFIESNIYDLPNVLSEQFDIVFTSYGVLCWLPDIDQWARIVAHFLKRGGVFYIVEGHPTAAALADDATSDNLRLSYSYFGTGQPVTFEQDEGTYADPQARLANHKTYEYWHSLGSIVSALISAGLRIEFLHEFPFCAWARLPSMTKGDDGYFYLPDNDRRVPFLFSIRATSTEN